jgi:polar amino acid transport system substrate-binding protein
MTDITDAKAELAPTGVLRAGINLSNFLLVTGRTDAGVPVGVAPDMAAEIARRLGVGVVLVPFKTPGELADHVGTDTWDIGLIGAEPQRAEKIAFTSAYVEIEATYLVPAGSKLMTIADVDKPGVRISSANRAAYDLWLQRNLKHATLVHSEGIQAAFDRFVADKLDAVASLKSRLIADAATLPGSRIIDGHFMAVQQAVGTARANTNGAQFLAAFVADAIRSGFVASLIARHKVQGLAVATP